MSSEVAVQTPLTFHEVATVVRDVENVDEAVQALPAEVVFLYLRRCEQVKERFQKWIDALELRARADSIGAHPVIDGEEYAFIGAQRHGYDQPDKLLAALVHEGIPAADLFAAVSEFRVTDVRAVADRIGKREQVEAVLTEYRIEKGARGPAHLVPMEKIEKYATKPKR